MNYANGSIIAALLIVGATVTQTQAQTKPRASDIRVETPADNSQLAEKNPQAFYLHTTSAGQAYLYVEKHDGTGLAVFDVTNPAKIRRIADPELSVNSAFDFVRSVDRNAVLIRYRDGSGTALMILQHRRHPAVVPVPEVPTKARFESLGQSGFLVADTGSLRAEDVDPQTYKVLDTSDVAAPRVLSTVSGVMQRASNEVTGTLFLLNDQGVTVVRRLRAEKAHQAELLREQNPN